MTTSVFIPRDGWQIAGRIDGPEDGPWLLVMHSLATSSALFEPNLADLTAHHRVLRLDARGHGSSGVPPGPYSFDDLVADAVASLDRFGIAQTDVLGLSMGGMTALGLALDHPNRLRRVVCANARAAFPPPLAAAWGTRAASVAKGGMAAIADDTLARWFTPAAPPDLVATAREMILATPSEGYRGCAAALERLDYLRRLPDLRVPLLFLAGGEDTAAAPEAMAEMAQATPGARLVVLPGVAHLANAEAPAAFGAAVTDFLAAADEAAPARC